jgi:hypothetical protein
MTEDHGFGRDALSRCVKRRVRECERNVGSDWDVTTNALSLRDEKDKFRT